MRIFSLMLLLAQLATFVCNSDAASPIQKIVIVFAGFNERNSFLYVAKDQHFFDQQGLQAEVVQVRSGPVAISALAANEAQFYVVAATGASLGAMAGGLDLAFIAGLINKVDGFFVVSPKIKSPTDLAGKTLGVQSVGGGIWMYTMLTLDHWGLDPDRDKIKFRILGDQSVIAQAASKGIIDGAFLSYTFAKVAERGGFRILADLSKADVPHQGIGVVARRSFCDQFPDIAEKTLRAFAKAVSFYKDPANKVEVTRTLTKWLRLSRVEDAESGYEIMRDLYDSRILPSQEGLRNTLRVLSRIDPKAAQLKAEALIDDRIARKLARAGF